MKSLCICILYPEVICTLLNPNLYDRLLPKKLVKIIDGTIKKDIVSKNCLNRFQSNFDETHQVYQTESERKLFAVNIRNNPVDQD